MFKILSLFQSRFTFFRSGQCKYLTFIYLTQYYFSLDLPFFIVFEVAFHFSMNVILILQECQGETLTEMYFSCPQRGCILEDKTKLMRRRCNSKPELEIQTNKM